MFEDPEFEGMFGDVFDESAFDDLINLLVDELAADSEQQQIK